MTTETIDIELLLDNAATASQNKGLLVDDDGNDNALRECVRLNVVDPLYAHVSEADGHVSNLVMLVGRLVQQLKRLDPENPVIEDAMGYLRRSDLMPSVTRGVVEHARKNK